MSDLEAIGNLLEAGLWFATSLVLWATSIKRAMPQARRIRILALTFLVFGVTDLIESQTGAWWRPLWLLALKAGCALVFAVLFRQYVIDRRLAHHNHEISS